ncbi:ABC-2 family transporter protein [Bifidobacterium lemurum]|uniref:ABC-2 family transporter protein n=1 Tax=Bifidobacterium lemurum TaxID=1603886 RepID=A0A261FTV3_9BIFI|nr:ABC-2 transporter permease [Bifidobacterium lemurum]OZG62383.1 ABC-2 family transporter protein [Bifidobacterium lemurum]QOL33739.1 ABC-2 transporter permease [Bifidobacterium lemurum]
MNTVMQERSRIHAIHPIVNAFRLDWQRLNSSGKASMAVYLVMLPALALLFGLLSESGGSSDMMMPVLGGMASGVFAMLPVYTFVYESQGMSRWMNGVIPVRRGHQVSGRYLVVLSVGLLLAVELTVSALVMAVTADAGAWRAAMEGYAANIAVIPVIYLLIESVLCPLLYRMPLQKAMLVLFGVAAALFGIGWITVELCSDVLSVTQMAVVLGALETLAKLEAGSLALIAAVVDVVALGVSYACSLRIYRAKEL